MQTLAPNPVNSVPNAYRFNPGRFAALGLLICVYAVPYRTRSRFLRAKHGKGDADRRYPNGRETEMF